MGMSCPSQRQQTYIEELDAYAGELPFLPDWKYLIREYLAKQFRTLIEHDATGAETLDYVIADRHDYGKPEPLPETVKEMWHDVAADAPSLQSGQEQVKERAAAEYGGLPPQLSESIEFYLPPSDVPEVSEWWLYVRDANLDTINRNIAQAAEKLGDSGVAYVNLIEELTRLAAGDIACFEEELVDELDRLAIMVDMDVPPMKILDYYMTKVYNIEDWHEVRDVSADTVETHVETVTEALTPPGESEPTGLLPDPNETWANRPAADAESTDASEN